MIKFAEFIGGRFIEPELCDRLIAYHKNPNTPKYQGVSSSGQVNKLVKDSIDCHLLEPELKRLYTNELWYHTREYMDHYKYCAFGAPDWNIQERINIQYYPPGAGFHAWHCERNAEEPSIRRHLVFMTYLNNVNDGGETEFLHQGVRIKPRKGLTLIWPTDWTFLHRGIPSFTEEKYVVTGWYSFIRG